MSQYNNYHLPFLGENQIHHHSGQMDPFNDFIHNTSNIRTISLNGSKLLNDECINMQKDEEIMIEYFLREVTKFITKWGIEMVPIDICIAVNDVKNAINDLTTWPELDMKLYRKPD